MILLCIKQLLRNWEYISSWMTLTLNLNKCEEKSFAWIRVWILSAHMHMFVVKQIVEIFWLVTLLHLNLIRQNKPPQRQDNIVTTSTSCSFDMGIKRPGSSRYRTHCGEKGHTKSRCYDLIGYPEWWDPSKASKYKVKPSTTPSFVSTSIAEVSPPNVTSLHINVDEHPLMILLLLDLVHGLLIL